MKSIGSEKVYGVWDYVKSFGSYFLVLGFTGFMFINSVIMAVENVKLYHYTDFGLLFSVFGWGVVFFFIFSIMFLRKKIEAKLDNLISKFG